MFAKRKRNSQKITSFLYTIQLFCVWSLREGDGIKNRLSCYVHNEMETPENGRTYTGNYKIVFQFRKVVSPMQSEVSGFGCIDAYGFYQLRSP